MCPSITTPHLLPAPNLFFTLTTLICSPSLTVYHFKDFYLNGITQFVTFGDSFIQQHPFPEMQQSWCEYQQWVPLVAGSIPSVDGLLYSPAEGHLGCFNLGFITNKAAKDIQIQVCLYEPEFSFLWDKCPEHNGLEVMCYTHG